MRITVKNLKNLIREEAEDMGRERTFADIIPTLEITPIRVKDIRPIAAREVAIILMRGVTVRGTPPIFGTDGQNTYCSWTEGRSLDLYCEQTDNFEEIGSEASIVHLTSVFGVAPTEDDIDELYEKVDDVLDHAFYVKNFRSGQTGNTAKY